MPINYKEYPSNWKTEIRPAVLKRANNCCENCGVLNQSIICRHIGGTFHYIGQDEHEMIKSKVRYSGYTFNGAMKRLGFTRIILTIAHLDHDKENHEINIDRLRALCQKCHLQYDMQHHIANRKYGLNHKKNNYKLDL